MSVLLLIAAILIGILTLLALLSIPFYWIFPDYHVHVWDCDGNEHQRQRLAKWRSKYSQLGFRRRFLRGIKKRRRAIGTFKPQ